MKKIIVFESIHYTIKADKILQKEGFQYRIIQTPREISSECGMSIETEEKNFDELIKYLKKNNLHIRVFHV